MLPEEYKNIEDKAKYVVDNLDYIEIYRDGQIFNTKTGKFLRQFEVKSGYLQVNVPIYDINEKCIGQFSCLAHRIIGWKFVENPNNLPQINHKNHCKTDNRACNLEFCDNSYNNKDKEAYYKCLGIDLHKKSKVIDDCGKVFESYHEAGIYYQCVAATIHCSVNKGCKAKGHHFYKYEN